MNRVVYLLLFMLTIGIFSAYATPTKTVFDPPGQEFAVTCDNEFAADVTPFVISDYSFLHFVPPNIESIAIHTNYIKIFTISVLPDYTTGCSWRSLNNNSNINSITGNANNYSKFAGFDSERVPKL